MKKGKKQVKFLIFIWATIWCITTSWSCPHTPSVHQADIIIYGGTSAAIMAAIQAKKMGKSVLVVSPDVHLGGLSSGGLGFTDSGDKTVIGGLAREFYHRLYLHYAQDSAWRWQARSEYGNKGQSTVALDSTYKTMWIFEPHVAEAVFETLVKEYGITIHRNTWLNREKGGVVKKGTTIVSFTTLDGAQYKGKMFIDATYEGDLMAAAGVSYHVGREANSVYGETWNGVQAGIPFQHHEFKHKIDPYLIPGNPASGLLPEISPDPPGENGSGDKRMQAYCFRMCMSTHPTNRVPFPRPAGYNPARYALLPRLFQSGWLNIFGKYDPIPNRKTDTNNSGPFSTDYIGGNYDYPEASYARRRQIIQAHEDYQKGYFYFLQNDPSVPAEIRTRMQEYGLAKDEFKDNGHWPHQLYIREARRMVGAQVMTEHHVLRKIPVEQSVGMGSYMLDSHNTQRYVTREGYVQNEGDVEVPTGGPYSIDYRSLIPSAAECSNLLVPVCISSSHIAFGSIRMEPVFMILGQSAAAAAALCIDRGHAVQQLPYTALRPVLERQGQVLYKAP